MPPNRALVAAIALSRTPSLAAVLRSQGLPAGVELLLRILARDPGAAQEARAMTGLRETELTAIAELYVLQAMLYQGASSRRILGVAPDADRAEARAHLRHLLNWLHPDKNANPWHAAFARRVIDAWRQIDHGLEGDERPRGMTAGGHRSARARRMPWIALPSEAARGRSGRRSGRGLRASLAGLTLICGVTVPDAAPYEVGRALLATIFFDAMPAASTRAAVSGLR
jgi:hypothetical protein